MLIANCKKFTGRFTPPFAYRNWVSCCITNLSEKNIYIAGIRTTSNCKDLGFFNEENDEDRKIYHLYGNPSDMTLKRFEKYRYYKLHPGKPVKCLTLRKDISYLLTSSSEEFTNNSGSIKCKVTGDIPMSEIITV